MKKILLYTALVILYLLHNDLWYWDDSRLIFGIPIGLLYHVLYCIAATLMMIALVKFAWPQDLDVAEGDSNLK
jgi:hypothetical protein